MMLTSLFSGQIITDKANSTNGVRNIPLGARKWPRSPLAKIIIPEREIALLELILYPQRLSRSCRHRIFMHHHRNGFKLNVGFTHVNIASIGHS